MDNNIIGILVLVFWIFLFGGIAYIIKPTLPIEERYCAIQVFPPCFDTRYNKFMLYDNTRNKEKTK